MRLLTDADATLAVSSSIVSALCTGSLLDEDTKSFLVPRIETKTLTPSFHVDNPVAVDNYGHVTITLDSVGARLDTASVETRFTSRCIDAGTFQRYRLSAQAVLITAFR